MNACTHWNGATSSRCGTTPARLYIGGWRCPSHTPAALAQLLAALDDIETRVHRAYRDGYHDGHAAGWDIGHAHAHEHIAAEWAHYAARIRAVTRHRTLAERAALDDAAARGEPCPARCWRCSRCIRAHAVHRHGGDYLGGPAAWDTTARGAA
ncbi:hypothetical protein HNP84_000208 [Thermocatellispora tengchongensis]|uniref:Uncharacterized protein n=1 Tax=Thermocatellispora tengchongensis TaxID=1073253 RepID=A0A840NZE0_9ACTN|nr:hypothetical protein [Thermocatellispora tengchongensis]MBB5130520.1 hypothetical protein [Thermocatellispora tengchongensis]